MTFQLCELTPEEEKELAKRKSLLARLGGIERTEWVRQLNRGLTGPESEIMWQESTE